MAKTFERFIGTEAGRIKPVGFTAPAGAYVVCLGSDRAGYFDTLNTGDYIEVHQTADFSTTKVARITARLRAPSAIPAGARWAFLILIDDVEIARRNLVAGKVRDIVDMGVSVANLAAGNHKLAFRLALEAA